MPNPADVLAMFGKIPNANDYSDIGAPDTRDPASDNANAAYQQFLRPPPQDQAEQAPPQVSATPAAPPAQPKPPAAPSPGLDPDKDGDLHGPTDEQRHYADYLIGKPGDYSDVEQNILDAGGSTAPRGSGSGMAPNGLSYEQNAENQKALKRFVNPLQVVSYSAEALRKGREAKKRQEEHEKAAREERFASGRVGSSIQTDFGQGSPGGNFGNSPVGGVMRMGRYNMVLGNYRPLTEEEKLRREALLGKENIALSGQQTKRDIAETNKGSNIEGKNIIAQGRIESGQNRNKTLEQINAEKNAANKAITQSKIDAAKKLEEQKQPIQQRRVEISQQNANARGQQAGAAVINAQTRAAQPSAEHIKKSAHLDELRKDIAALQAEKEAIEKSTITAGGALDWARLGLNEKYQKRKSMIDRLQKLEAQAAEELKTLK